MRRFFKTAVSAFSKTMVLAMGSKNFERLLIYMAKAQNIDLHLHGLVQNGARPNINIEVNGEKYFVAEVLSKFIEKKSTPVFFDVGANVGDYSIMLREYHPTAAIYAFEPITNTFQILVNNTKPLNLKRFNIGFSDSEGIGELFNGENFSNNQITTAYRDALSEMFEVSGKIVGVEYKKDTIDNFCEKNGISEISFLKIDVEGHELAVLKGASKLLSEDKISVIQFEFNEHNIFSRVFLRDFYNLLPNFELFRLLSGGMIKLGPYNAKNEIFLLQNIIAIRKDLCHLAE